MPYKRETFSNVLQIFGGIDIFSTPDIVTKKGKAEYILNCYNYPDGGIAKIFGRSKHNSTTIGTTAEITGIFELPLAASRPFFCISEAKFYIDNAGAWENRTGSVVVSDSKNNLWGFSKFQDLLIGTSLDRDTPIEHDGGAGNAANVSNMPVGKFCKPIKNRLIVYNTAAQPKLGYWCATDDRTSWDTVNNYLNFKGSEADDAEISGVAEHQDNHIIGKANSLFRLYHTATEPPFKYYRIDSKIGVAGHFTMQSVPAAGIHPPRLIWMGRDNFYQLTGDSVTAIGDDIKPFFSEGAPFQINLSRLPYYTSGLITEKNLYWCSFSSGSQSSNDYCFVLDYKNMMWALCNFPINCFGARQISGREFLYSGTYDGFVAKHDPAVYNNLGSYYTSEYWTCWIDFGDTQLEKKIRYLIGLMDAVGAFNLAVSYRSNLGGDWVSLGNLSSSVGADILGIDFVLGTSTLGVGVDIVESIVEVLKRFKRIQLRFIQANTDQYFRLLALGFLWEKMRGYRIGS